MKKPVLNTILVVSGTLAITLIGSGCDVTAGFGQVLENVQSVALAGSKERKIGQEHKEAGDLFISLSDKHNFFAARYKGCHAAKNAIICDTFYKDKNTEAKSETNTLKPAQIAKALRRQQFAKMAELSPASSKAAVAALNPLDKKNLTKNLMSSKECASPHLYSALAYKLEEQLPEAKVKTAVLSLYKKAMACSEEKDLSELGLYRLGLLLIADENFEEAIPALEKLANHSEEVANKSRAQFWINYSKRQLGQKISDNDLEKHFNNSPLSYHTLSDYAVLEDGPFQTISENSDKKELHRTVVDKLNNAIQLIEYFFEMGRMDLAKRGLEFIDYNLLATAEPGFQLYVATLISRYDDLNHQRFTVLSRLFQRYPDFKTVKNLNVYYPLIYQDLVLEHRRDQDPYLLIALMRQESSFNPSTKSPVGATGLMQLMPRTAQELHKNVQEKDLLEPATNIRLGARYFSKLVKQFDSDYMKALASYNAGAGNVRKWEKRYPVSNPLLFVDLIPFDETREYVSSILRNQYWYSRLYPELKLSEQVASANIKK